MSKIEDIVLKKIKKEYEIQVERLSNDFEQKIHDFKNMYKTTLETLDKLEITDATLFDFFEKTDGNIRIKTLEKKGWNDYIDVTYENLQIFNNNKIVLEQNKSYKIILMAIEQKDD